MKKNPFDDGYYSSSELVDFGFKSVGHNVMVAKNCTIVGLHNISLGNNVRIDEQVKILSNTGFLNLGNYIHIGSGSYLGCSGGITMADFSGLSQGVHIYSATDDYSGASLTNPTVPKAFTKVRCSPVHLHMHVIIGSGTVILPGVSIGCGSSVGALSLVNRSLDEWGIYFGLPAKKIKDRSKDLLDLEKKLLDTLSVDDFE